MFGLLKNIQNKLKNIYIRRKIMGKLMGILNAFSQFVSISLLSIPHIKIQKRDFFF